MKRNKEQHELREGKKSQTKGNDKHNRKCMKEIRQRHTTEQNKANLPQQKRRGNERRQKQKIVEQTHKGRSTTNLYPANTREVGPR